MLLGLKRIAAGIMGEERYTDYKERKMLLNQIGDKNIIIYGTNEEAIDLDRYLEKKRKGKGCDFFIDDEIESKENYINGKQLKRTEDLILEEQWKRSIILIVSCHNAVKKTERLLDLGVNLDYILRYREDRTIGAKQLDCYDVNLGYSRYDTMLGFTAFGEENRNEEDSYIIVTLGGSTTDPTFCNIKSWSQYLYERLKGMGIKATIFCGGMSAINSSQELVKLIRDIVPMKPDMVLSYSGTNNIDANYSDSLCKNTPFIWNYQIEVAENSLRRNELKNRLFRDLPIKTIGTGLNNKKSFSEYWVDDIRMMHAICEEFHISFFAFLQPHRLYGGYITNPRELGENSTEYADGVGSWFEDVRQRIEGLDYIFDFSQLFFGKKNIYIDTCHVYEKGNKIIADAILKVIIKYIRKGVK